MRGRRTPAIASSPVLVGAVTLLVTIVAVFLAYNANQGLPFVPTYRLNAELPSGSGLVRGNEVRVGGHRVGAVGEIRTKRVEVEGRPQAIAEIQMELEGSLEELPADTELLVRPRSALGLKYVELEPGESTRTLPAGSTVPLANADEPVELEDVLSTFDADTRVASRASLEGYGDAFAGRGEDLNRTIAALRPVVVHLEPVMRVLSDPDTQLDELFRQIGRSAAQVAPVAELQARLFGDMARTFAALVRNPDALRATIERSPETLDASISSFRVQQPFLADLAALSRELGPAARELPRSLPAVNVALRAGQPALAGAPRPNALVGAVLGVRRAVPDGLQLLELLLGAARRAHLRAGPERDDRARPARHDERDAGRPGRDADRRPLRRRARGPGPAAGRGQRRLAAHAPRDAVLRPGDRRAGQRRLPGRPDGLPGRPAEHDRSLPALARP
jgi:virulence factor Mce-like protein